MNNFWSLMRPYISLMKLRIIVLLLITAMGSLFVVSKGVPNWTITIAVLIGGALTAGGANAINQYLDRDIDAKMPRTKKRPIPSNLISGTNTLLFGVFITLIGFVLLLTLANLFKATKVFFVFIIFNQDSSSSIPFIVNVQVENNMNYSGHFIWVLLKWRRTLHLYKLSIPAGFNTVASHAQKTSTLKKRLYF